MLPVVPFATDVTLFVSSKSVYQPRNSLCARLAGARAIARSSTVYWLGFVFVAPSTLWYVILYLIAVYSAFTVMLFVPSVYAFHTIIHYKNLSTTVYFSIYGVDYKCWCFFGNVRLYW